MEEKCRSKNWKERQEAYQRLGSIWENSQEYIELLPLLQNETNIPALETAIDAILKTQNPPQVEEVKKIFNQIGNMKTSIKARVNALVEYVGKEDPEGVVLEMVGLLKSKTPKTVCGAVSGLVEISKYEYDLELVGDSLQGILGHADQNVRGEGKKLVVELFKKNGDRIRRYIAKLKPIQLKELEEEFNKIEKPVQRETKAVELSSKLIKKCNDEKWNIRLEGLSELKKAVEGSVLDKEVVGLLATRVNDPNNQVFFEALEIIARSRLKNQRILNSIVERLKDKKGSVTEKIKEALLKMEIPEENIQREYFTHKNPQVKINMIDYCILRKVKRKDLIEMIKKCQKDQNAQVRNKANEAIKELSNVEKEIGNVEKELSNVEKEIGNIKKTLTPIATPVKREKSSSKIGSSRFSIDSSRSTSNIPTTKSTTNSTTFTPTTKSTTNTPTYYGPTKEEKENILESFYSKYPFFREKAWNSRLESFRENIPQLAKENVRELVVFFYSHKEAIFQLSLAYMDLLLVYFRDSLYTVQNTVMLYCTEKATENKLSGKIVEIFKVLHPKESLEFLKNEIKNQKQGKKLIALLKLVGELASRKQIEEFQDILEMPVIGINEKKALEELKKKLEEEKEEEENNFVKNNFVEEEENNFVKNNFVEEGSINITNGTTNGTTNITNGTNTTNTTNGTQPIPNSSHMILKESINETLSIINSTRNILKKNFSTSKNHRTFESVFTPEFVRMMETGDFNRVVDLLESINRIEFSDLVIRFYISKKLPSAFFNSLILFFISERYILREAECLELLGYLLEEDYKEELKMMDRIYPVTKLFFVLQRIGTEESTNEILRLISKYKMFRGNKKKLVEELKKTNREALKTAIRGCPDFLSFVDEIEGQFMTPQKTTKNNSKENIDIGKLRNQIDAINKASSTLIIPPPTSSTTNTTNTLPPANTYTNSTYTTNTLPPANTYTTSTTPLLLESSIHSLSITSTPTANNKLEEILDNLIDSNPETSEMALRNLSEIVDQNISSILFSANSIVSSISIQLLDVLHKKTYSTYSSTNNSTTALEVLLKLSRSPLFCSHLRRETLESVHSDLISILSRNQDVVGDIITNLCLNSNPSIVLQVYLSLYTTHPEICLKLIWRHSKNLHRLTSRNIKEIVDSFEDFYSKNIYSKSMEDYTTFKILTLHIKEIVSKGGEVAVVGYTKKLVELYRNKKEVTISELRKYK
ncbi:Protein mini spindle [Nosema granulosis]|uniref:Protein mini spindle n=1 Tax=Nosema granulosis TaxID=83296 RepID=A0A9P6KYY9_9MICR|nr:Protein mini spindle [Nosema granulosis]